MEKKNSEFVDIDAMMEDLGITVDSDSSNNGVTASAPEKSTIKKSKKLPKVLNNKDVAENTTSEFFANEESPEDEKLSEEVIWNDTTNITTSNSLQSISNEDIDFFYVDANNIPEVNNADTEEIETADDGLVYDEEGNLVLSSEPVVDTDLNGNKRKRSKNKKRPSKAIKIAKFTSLSTVLIMVVVVASMVLNVLFTKGAAIGIDSSVLKVETFNEYYAGTNGIINLKKLFPLSTSFVLDPSSVKSCEISDVGKVSSITKDFTVTVNGGAWIDHKANFKVIQNAQNVDTYKDLYKFAHTPIAKLNAGKFNNPVCIQAATLKMDYKPNKIETIVLSNDLYGNGVCINAFKLVSEDFPNGSKESAAAFEITHHTQKYITFRDIQVMGKEAEETDHIKSFTSYSNLLSIVGGTKTDKEDTIEFKAFANVINCVFEKGHKVVHVRNSQVNFEGCIIRQASDTALSIGTFANEASEVHVKNSVIADSLTGGILMYAYDNTINKSCDNEKTWNKVYIEGFVDIFNWKKVDELAFLPDTEGEKLAALVNPIIGSTVAPPGNFADLKVTIEKTQYIHFGIIKIFTGTGFSSNKSYVIGYEALGYTTMPLPIPDIAKMIMKDIAVWGYFGNNGGSVDAERTLGKALEEGLYKDMKYGRS